nr:hypothetical protein [Tanacetum cinerariifolium]
MLQICPRIPNQQFDELPFEEAILTFLRELGHSGEIKVITDVNIIKLHQPWRSFAAVINKCLSGKSTGYESLRLSQAQILWGMYHKKNVYFAYLLWEDFVYQAEHKDAKKSNEMYYPRFTKVIINFFMTKDESIIRRNKYGAILPIELTNEAIKNSESYKEYYAIASGVEPPKTKASVRKKQRAEPAKTKPSVRKKQSSSETIMPPPTAKGKRLKTSAKVDKPAKEKQPAKTSKAKGADEGTSIIPRVPDVPTYESDDEEISWKSSEEDDDDEVNMSEHDEDVDDQSDDDDQNDDDDGDQDDGDQDDDDDQNDNDDDDQDDDDDQNDDDDDDDDFDPIVQTPSHDENTNDEDNNDDSHENEEFLNKLDENIQKIIKEQVKEQVKAQVSKILPKIEKTVNEQLKAEVLTRSSNLSKTSHVVATNLSELEVKKILIEKMESNKSIHRSNEQKNLYKALVDAYECDKLILDTYRDTVTLKRCRDDKDKDEEPSARSNRGSKRRRARKEPEATKEPMHTTRDLEEPAHQEFDTGATDDQPIEEASQHPDWKDDSRTLFNELMDTPLDFLALVMNQLKVDTLTPELLAGLTYELMKGSCKSLVELEFFVKKVYKATTGQLDWNNPEGQQYPHDLRKPLPLIPTSRGRRVISFDHFINNDLEYLPGPTYELMKGSCKSLVELEFFVKKVYKATTGQLDWNNPKGQQYPHDLRKPLPLIPTSWGRRVISFDHFINNDLEIIAVTELQIFEWHNYKNLDWITVRRDDDKLYKFKEGDFKRLRIQDIKDMLLLLVQGKLTNLTVDERLAINVSLRMFTRSIVIQQRMKDLQLVSATDYLEMK